AIEVTVVDITGETHTASTNVNVGYVALELGVNVNKEVNRDSLTQLKIRTQNLSGAFAAASGTLSIDRLRAPDRPLKTRLWAVPDRFLMTKETFKQDFPNDVYHDEDQMTKWPIAANQLTQAFDTEKEKMLTIDPKNWPLGSYVLTLKTQDRYGTVVELKKFFTLYDLDEKVVPLGLSILDQLDQKMYQPGERAQLRFGSSMRPSSVLFEVEEDQQVVRREWIAARDIRLLELDIKEKHLGNFHYQLSFVQENRPHFQLGTISVPWKEKELTIEYGTFRDKLYPGQEEEWSIKISGHKKDKVAAELLAGMYDASLDQFARNQWMLNLFPNNYRARTWRTNNFTTINGRILGNNWQANKVIRMNREYPSLNWFGFQFRNMLVNTRSQPAMLKLEKQSSAPAMRRAQEPAAAPEAVYELGDEQLDSETNQEAIAGNVSDDVAIVEVPDEEEGQDLDLSDVKIRTNLNETVFFFPNLMTDEAGNVILKFTMNEALTRWKFMGLAHTKDLKTAVTEKEVVTQKDLMVIPNPPRFMREGDQIEFTAKVSNLTAKTMSGTAVLQLFDALTMKPVDDLLGNQNASIRFTANAGQSDRLAWTLNIPKGKVMAITHRVMAKAGDFSDGEESTLPVLTNRMLVTETQPLPVYGKQRTTFNFEAMKKASASSTLQHHRYTLEFTSNPAWLAVQALPYIMDYPYQCTEQIFNRFYANSLASSVANQHPKIKRVFEQWKNTAALESNLSKNQELKSALLEETPWVLQAQSEAQQKKNIGLLFDLNRMAYEQEQAMTKLAERQLGNGGFSWFPGGRDSRYITQYLVEGMGHLNQLGVKVIEEEERMAGVLKKAVQYIDNELMQEYKLLEEAIHSGRTKWEDDHLSNMAIHYLYTRSFYLEIDRSDDLEKVQEYYLNQAEKYWLKKGIYQEGMIALALNRNGRKDTPAKIVRSLKERSLNHPEMGMYWNFNRGYYWYQLPIESHALMIEVFDEVANDEQAVNDLKVWLLKTKQTTHWKTTKATAAAVYALLNGGENCLLSDEQVSISFTAASNTRWNE
ncbi:MAG: alpha-2-macroglobulin family protein, partial [Bacteroidota bacterium]